MAARKPASTKEEKIFIVKQFSLAKESPQSEKKEEPDTGKVLGGADPQKLSFVIPSEPSETINAKYWKILREFCQDTNQQSKDFPNLDTNERKIVHDVAESFNLEHISTGKGTNRYLQVSKKKPKPDQWQLKGYIGLFGQQIEQIIDSASIEKYDIPASAFRARESRDGREHHVTFFSPPELGQIAEEGINKLKKAYPHLEKIVPSTFPSSKSEIFNLFVDILACTLNCLPTLVGVGKVNEKLKTKENEENSAWFIVLDWPEANKFRQEMGLPPKDFHITLAFVKSDIHSVSKDRSTLIEPKQFEKI